MPAAEAKLTLDLVFTEKSNRIDNLAAGSPFADLRRGHVSLKFDFILDYPGYTMTNNSKLNYKRANFTEITNHFDSIKLDKLFLTHNPLCIRIFPRRIQQGLRELRSITKTAKKQ